MKKFLILIFLVISCTTLIKKNYYEGPYDLTIEVEFKDKNTIIVKDNSDRIIEMIKGEKDIYIGKNGEEFDLEHNLIKFNKTYIQLKLRKTN